MPTQFRNLPSIQIHWQQLSDKQKSGLKNQIKSRVAVLFIQATQCITNKNLKKARQLVIQIADLCMLIKDPDQQVQKWMQIASSYTAIIYQSEERRLEKNNNQEKKRKQNKKNQLFLHYNKFSSQFQLKIDESQQQLLGDPSCKHVLHYVSKINSILFGYQNAASNSPLYVMFISYIIPFLLSIVFLVLIIIYLVSKNFLNQMGSTNFGLQIHLVLIGLLLIIPMIMIMIKTPEQKNNLFFSKKLVQQIRQINQDCKQRGKKIQFSLSGNGYVMMAKIEREQAQSDKEQKNENEKQFMGKIQQLKEQISKVSRKQIFLFQNNDQKTSRQEFLRTLQDQ